MKLCVFGSRTLIGQKDSEFIEEKIKEFHQINKIDYILIPGSIDGACRLAFKVAEKLCIPVTLYFYNKRDTDSRWRMIDSIKSRTRQIIKEADFFLVFHDGESKGTLWDLKQIKKVNKGFEYFLLDKTRESAIDFDGFNLDGFNLDVFNFGFVLSGE
ncbi:MAG: hypothetical protein NTV01_05595 [Bacteroidia bacterium]|nr:hypothetical protein [Bacteroidia bacterium]